MADKGVEAVFKVPNPQVFADPDKIRFADLYKYRSVSDIKRGIFWGRIKASSKFLGGTLAFCLFCVSLGKSDGRLLAHGENGNGGELLKLTSILSDDDINYNREFQRMRFLQQGHFQNSEATNGYALAEQGVASANVRAASEYRKKAPHHKYY